MESERMGSEMKEERELLLLGVVLVVLVGAPKIHPVINTEFHSAPRCGAASGQSDSLMEINQSDINHLNILHLFSLVLALRLLLPFGCCLKDTLPL